MNQLFKHFKSIAKAPKIHPGGVGYLDSQMAGWHDSQNGALAEGFVITADDTVLDVGCGDGGAASFAGAQGAEVIVTDIIDANVKKSLRKLNGSRARAVEGHVSDSDPLPIEASRASRVMCMEVLEHVPDPSQFLSELVRVGEPGAQYLLTVPDPASEAIQKQLAPDCYWESPNHLRVYSHEDFENLVTSAGLVIERKVKHGFYWAMWWTLFWAAGQELGEPEVPMLSHWTHCWHHVLNSKDGERIKDALDNLMPKSQGVIARKPG